MVIKAVEKFLSHFRALEIIRLSSDVVAQHSLRHQLSDISKATDTIGTAAGELTKLYLRVKSDLERGDVEHTLSIPDTSEMSLEELATLKSQLSKTVSSIDRRLLILKEESSKNEEGGG